MRSDSFPTRDGREVRCRRGVSSSGTHLEPGLEFKEDEEAWSASRADILNERSQREVSRTIRAKLPNEDVKFEVQVSHAILVRKKRHREASAVEGSLLNGDIR